MPFEFGAFTLDEGRRELKLRGRDVLLQPRVFDVLAYLVRHRDRTVGKEEILATLWPGVVVTDGSLQRAVSLARSALREGGLPDAVRTHARRGYRFCADVEDREDKGGAMEVPGTLARARRAFERCEWAAAAAAFAAADRDAALGGADLERWAEAGYWLGTPEPNEVLLRAVAAHAAAGDRRGAARAATALGQIGLERRDLAVASGWNRRAATLLQGEPTSREHGMQQWLASRIAAFEGREQAALELAERVHAIGRELDDPDVEALGLVYRGLLLLARGETERSVALQDEAAATVLAEKVSPRVGGLVYCGLIWSCRNNADWERAAQWTEHFTKWCTRFGLDSFPGTCKLHRAEVLSVRGALGEALREIKTACETFATIAPWAEGDAYRVLGDLLLTRGDTEDAASAYRRAHELGWDPQPGLALLQLAAGRSEEAILGLERALDDPGWPNRQRRGQLLAHLVVVAVSAGKPDRARTALAELDRRPELSVTPALQAMVAHARAEVAGADRDLASAVRWLRTAIRSWRDVGSPIRVAQLRLRLAEVLRESGDRAGAELELDAAEAAARALDLRPLLAACAAARI